LIALIQAEPIEPCSSVNPSSLLAAHYHAIRISSEGVHKTLKIPIASINSYNGRQMYTVIKARLKALKDDLMGKHVVNRQ